MHILCDISHPAHVHFFRNSIDKWREHGHEVTIISRKKEITTDLLEMYGYQHTCLSKMRKGALGLGIELLEHEGRLFAMSLKHTPDVFVEIAGTFIVHAAELLRKPSIVFYDTEHAKVSNAITYPFASAVCTPSCYMGDAGKHHVRYEGYHELAYLHPNYFSPNPAILKEAGLTEDEPFFLVRFISWSAAHDIGKKGLTIEIKREMVKRLSQLGRVIITTEKELPAEFEQYRLRVRPDKVHHLLAYSSLYVGEGATMASEAALLGTPAVYVSSIRLGYLNEQETKYGMVRSITEGEQAIECAVEIANTPNLKAVYREKSKKLLADKIDVTAWMVDFVENFQR